MSKDMATAGYYNYTPMFVGVDGSDPAIKDIVPSSTEATSLEGGVISLYVLDTNRKFLKTFIQSFGAMITRFEDSSQCFI